MLQSGHWNCAAHGTGGRLEAASGAVGDVHGRSAAGTGTGVADLRGGAVTAWITGRGPGGQPGTLAP